MNDPALLVFSTFPDRPTAHRIARELVEERLAACANLLPALESIYRWDGKLEENTEVLVLFKTTEARFPALQVKLRSLHPYEVPEIVAVPVAVGLPAYLRWVAENSEPL